MNILKRKIRKAKVISFDIFNTLLVRPFIKPENTFDFLGELLKEPDFAKYREDAESTLRTKGIGYATYDDIYSILPERYHYIKEIECKFEKKILFLNPKMKDVYDYALSLNKRIILTTDMYYSSEFISELLHENGYHSFERIYVSGELKKAKYDFTLFPYIINDLKIKPQEILHIGDTKLSDFDAPKKVNMSAYLIESPINIFIKKYPTLTSYIDSHKDNLTSGIIIGLAIKNMLLNPSKTNYWNFIGYFWAGAFCFGLSEFIVSEMRKDNRKELICVARDGYTIEKIVNLIEPSIKTHYIYAPRSINLITSIDYNEELPWTHKAKSIVKLFCKESNKFYQIYQKCSPKTQAEYIKLIENNRSLLNPIAKSIYATYIKYLEKFAVHDNRIALFDITAGAYSSLKILSKSYPNKDILGLYFFALENKNFNYRKYSEPDKNAVYNYELLELFVTAPELPVSSIDLNGKFKTIDNKYEKFRMKIYKYIFEGELLWAKNYIDTYNFTINFDSNALIDFINIFCETYSLKDYLNFRCVYHGFDEAHTIYKRLLRFRLYLNLKNILKFIFSIKNAQNHIHKIITILGIKIKIKKYTLSKDELEKNKKETEIKLENKAILSNIKRRVSNEIPVVMSCDDNYAPYLGVTIKSLIENSSANNEYTVYVLDGGLKESTKKKLNKLETKNVKIKYVDVERYFEDIDKNIFYLCDHFSISAYYRFFIPQIFKNFEKVIYCDCDAVFLADVAELYNTDIGDKILGVAHDTEAIMQVHSNKNDKYYSEFLKLKNPYNYFQSGMLLMNINKMKEINFTKQCLDKLRELKTPRYVDQCVMNSAFEDQVYFLDNDWNVENHIMVFNRNVYNLAPYQTAVNYYTGLENPKYLHFSGWLKPWKDPSTYNADLFWEYAKKTPFYEEIIYKNTKFIQVPMPILEKQKFYKNFLQRIFSVKNLRTPNKTYKVFTILGIKFKFSMKTKK